MQLFYSDEFAPELPPGHRFPLEKYRRLRQRLQADPGFAGCRFVAAEPVGADLLTSVHDAAYVRAVLDGTLDAKAQRRIGLPWSRGLADRARASVGASLDAARAALREGVAGTLSGGTHHAHAGFGAGFCVFNDLAIVATALLDGGSVEQVTIVDLDVHQGDGTAAILAGRRDVFLLSVHGAKNFPFRKACSSLDVAVEDGAGDRRYLELLDPALDVAFGHRPDLVLYVAGTDVLEADRLGRLALSAEGVAERDGRVLARCREDSVPVVVCMGGGYAEPIDVSVAAHARTFEIALELFGDARSRDRTGHARPL